MRTPRRKSRAESSRGPLRRRLIRWAARLLPVLAIHWTRDPRLLGELGEHLAARHLAARGWTVLGRGVRTSFAEIDLVCRNGRNLVCVEVKTGWIREDRPHRLRPRDRLRPRRLARQMRAAGLLARRHGLPAERARVDLLEWTLGATRGRPWPVLRGVHLQDVRHGAAPSGPGTDLFAERF